MRILVTGGKGYIGSVLCLLLSDKRHEFLSFDIKDGQDITDEKAFAATLKSFAPEAIIHLAAASSVPECEENPERCNKVNVKGVAQLTKLMQQQGCKKLVFASSSAIYDDSRNINPKNLYGSSKLEGEKIIKASGVNAVILRLFNAAGAHPELKAGECHEPETHIIPLSIRAAMKGETLNIHGTGETIRDYVHVWDIAHAFEKAAALSIEGQHIAEIGTGTGHSVLQVVSGVEEVTGKKINRVHVNPRKEISKLISDPSSAKKILDWEPEVTALKDIISSEYEWQRSGHGCGA